MARLYDIVDREKTILFMWWCKMKCVFDDGRYAVLGADRFLHFTFIDFPARIHSHLLMVIGLLHLCTVVFSLCFDSIFSSSAHCVAFVCIFWFEWMSGRAQSSYCILERVGSTASGLSRCQKRSWSLAWNWWQKKTCHCKLSHLFDPNLTPVN